MPDHLPVSLPNGLSIKKTRHLPVGADVSFEITAQPGSAVLAALATNDPFPPGPIELAAGSVSVTREKTIPFGSSKGTVSFSGKADAYQRLAVLDEPADVVRLLTRDQVNEDIAAGLAIEKRDQHRFVLLRWGYHLNGAAKGSVALGAGPTVTFGAEAARLGAYAVVRQIPDTTGAATAIGEVFDAWMLPSQFRALDDVAPGTWIVAEVDGSIGVKLGAKYGYDFNWVREAVTLGGLSGDIGLKIQVGLEATFGFEASGQYTVALGRSLGSRALRLQVFRLNRKGLNLAYSAGVSAKGSFGGLLPDHFDEFLEGVFGLHGLQVLKELEKWTAPDSKVSELLAGVGLDYAKDFFTEVTGFDAQAGFGAGRSRLQDLLIKWQNLPHKVAATVYSLVERDVSALPVLRAQLTRLAGENPKTFRPDLEKLLSQVQFFDTPFGKWLESAVLTSTLAAVSDTGEYARVQAVAQKTLAVLDGSLLEGTLLRLQSEIINRIGLTRVQQIVDQASFDKADEWLKARLAAFLATKGVDNAQVQQIRTAISHLIGLRQKFFEEARKALTQKYELQILGSYQKSTTRTALIDAVFDFTAGAPAELNRLAAQAIDGVFDQLLFTPIAGVSLQKGVLTHEIKRQSHLEVSMPFMRVELDHLNTSLAKAESVDSERGRLVLYDLHADDLKTAKGKFASHLTIDGRFAQQGSTRVFDEVSLTHAYSFRQAMPMVRTSALKAQLGGYVEAYFPDTFQGGLGSFREWISDLDRTVDALLDNGPNNFGHVLLALDVVAPAASVGAWILAPQSPKADAYREMSVRIQKQLRKLVPLQYFQDLRRFNDRIPAAALLVYESLPVTTGIVVEGGRIVQFDDRRDIYPDIDASGHIEALVRSGRTMAGLATRLQQVHEMLDDSPDTAGIAGDYRASRAPTVLENALQDVGRADLDNLLRVERTVIRDARAAGVSIAKALKARKAADALQQLAEYGSKVTAAFNSTIGGLFGGNELRPLGTLVFIEAGAALDPTLSGRPSAMLELTVLKDAPVFKLPSFVEGEEPSAADIVNTQKFVSLG